MMKSRSTAMIALGFAVAACRGGDDVTSPSAALPASSTPTTTRAPADIIPGQYIVMLRQPVASASGATTSGARHTLGVMNANHGRVLATYHDVIDGFAAQLSDSAVQALRADPNVLSIEPDQIAEDRGSQTNAPWDLDRLDQTSLPLTGTYTYPNDGSGVSIYIIDSGIKYTDPDFGGRAIKGIDFYVSGGDAMDCKGHGTAVASLAGSNTYGVAKGATLVAVRVSGCSGGASFSTIINALDWVRAQKNANPTRPMVVNLSIGGGMSAAADTALARLIRANVVVTAASSNGAADACTSWPSDFRPAIVMSGMIQGDKWYTSGDYGPCVDLEAPAASVPALYINPFGGTSAATPIAAGAAALYLHANPTATPAQVEAALINGATVGKLTGVPANTANRIVNVSFIGGGTTPTNQPPTATISAPANGSSFAAGSSVTFTGSATDPEDGTLSGASLVWTSSINGQIGTGTSFATTTLSAGTHTITLTATDSKGATGTASRTVTITSGSGTSGAFSISPNPGSVAAGSTLQMTWSGGNVPPGTPVYWTSSNTAVATVGAYTGLVTGIKAGTVTIRGTAQTTNYPGASSTVTVH